MAAGSASVAAIGEVMVEFAPAGSGASPADYRLGFAGDTFNTAVGLARLGIATSYVTLLGDDPLSDRIIALMQQEGIGDALVQRLAGRQPGLYVIANAPDGERTFRYWRSESPARELWADDRPAQVIEDGLDDFSHIYLSGITLAIMQPPARQRLRTFLQGYRQRGGTVVFDSNYRPRLWADAGEARAAIGEFLSVADIALLTLEDEQALWGPLPAGEVLQRHRDAGVGELVIRQGPEPVITCAGGQLKRVDVPAVRDVVDTTGAGDAFNAGYLARRLCGGAAEEAAAWGSRAAGAVIRQRGAIGPREEFLEAMIGPGS